MKIPSTVYSSNPRPPQPAAAKQKPLPKVLISKSKKKSLETLDTLRRWKNELDEDLVSLNETGGEGKGVTFDVNSIAENEERIRTDEDKVARGRVVSNFGDLTEKR